MSYILVTGAPGSKWSSVVGDMYWSDSIDRSDYSKERTYGNREVRHFGVYFDPHLEYGTQREEWDKPFSGKGIRIIKSHTFSAELDTLKEHGYPIVLVHRNDYECYKWWIQAGGFNIKYPNYKDYYEDLDGIFWHIQDQNNDIMQFVKENEKNIIKPKDNFDLCELLKIDHLDKPVKEYRDKDIDVYVWLK